MTKYYYATGSSAWTPKFAWTFSYLTEAEFKRLNVNGRYPSDLKRYTEEEYKLMKGGK